MFLRFVLYSIFKNLRLFEAFFILYLVAPASGGGAALSFFQVGILTGYQRLITALLEVPSGFVADGWGRRKSVALCFACYTLAFPLYAWASSLDSGRLLVLGAAQTLFGVGEAFRTGTHKAIMLDWVDQTPGAPRATVVIGSTRVWSKLSSGAAAILGGLVLWQTGRFTWLFAASTLPAAAGVVLALGYPSWLDGAYVRGERRERPRWKDRLRLLRGMPGMVSLVAASILFESHIKVAQHYIQPLLKNAVESKSAVVVGGVGAVAIGLYYLIQDGIGAAAAGAAAHTEKRLATRALRVLEGSAPVALAGITLALLGSRPAAVIAGLLVLAMLQNVRRPIFVSRLNQLMDKAQGAATLSVESQMRSVGFAVLAPITGWIADHYGLPWAMGALACTCLVLLPPALVRRPGGAS